MTRSLLARRPACLTLALALLGCGADPTAAPAIEKPATPTLPATPAVPSGPSSQFVATMPAGWAGGGLPSYQVGTDDGVRHGGARSGAIRATGAAGSQFGVLTQLVRADGFRGRRVRLSGWLRVENATVPGQGAGLWLRIDAADETLSIDNMGDRRLGGSTDWTPVSVVADVPDAALGLTFGALLSGPGQLWVDDLRLEIVGADVPVTAATATGARFDATTQSSVQASYARSPAAPVNLGFDGDALDPAAVAWLRERAAPFDRTTPDGPATDLAPLGRMIGPARLAAFGEGTHGTAEFFQMKHRVLRYLVQELGFTAFAIEATWPEANAVNEYVLHGTGVPEALLSDLYFWTWNTQEVLDMIRWMRQWNLTAAPGRRVQFFGFDMQYPGGAIDSVAAFVLRVDPARSAAVVSAYTCLTPYRNYGARFATRSYGASVTAAAREACARDVAGAYDLLAGARAAYETAGGAPDYARALQSARLVVQWEDTYARTSSVDGSTARDRYMAENAGWLLGQLPAGARMMLWAHNAHVARAPGAMGSHLAARYGADYVPAAFAFGTGAFNAITILPNGTLGSLAEQFVGSVLPGSFEAYAQAAALSHFVLDARAIPGAPAAAVLAGPIAMRAIGSGFSPTATPSGSYQATLLPGDFDLVIYLATTTASLRLPFTNR